MYDDVMNHWWYYINNSNIDNNNVDVDIDIDAIWYYDKFIVDAIYNYYNNIVLIIEYY